MIAAQDERTARKGGEAMIQGRSTSPKRPVLTPEEAMLPDAPLVHPAEGEQLCQTGISRGNFDEAWKNAAHTVNVKVPDAALLSHASWNRSRRMAIPLANGADFGAVWQSIEGSALRR